MKTLSPTDPRHGTRNGYGNLSCRCERCPHWVTAMYRTGNWHLDDIRYAATEFPSAVIDAHSYWHSTPGHPPGDLATCGADICVEARAANPLLGLVVAGDTTRLPSTKPEPAWLTTCPNDRERLVINGEDRVCPTCHYVIVGGAR